MVGFTILDFPCNQFMEQAKGNDEEISSFCTLKYDTTFPRFKKIDVNGENESPLYTFLKNAIEERDDNGFSFKNLLLSFTSKINGKSGKKSDIKWNFEKFLVDKNGNLVGINTAIYSQTGSYSGYSFAVPVNIVKKIAYDLMDFGSV